MITLRGVSFRYGKRDILRNVNISFQDGITYVIGPNGAGKTTLLKVASGIYRPTYGEVLIDDVDIWRVDEKRALETRRKVVYVHERAAALRGTVLENLTYGFRIRGINNSEEALRRIEPLAEEMGIKELFNKKANELSAGQLQKIALVRALALRPRYLILDEPFSHLDESSVKTLTRIIKEKVGKDNMAVVIASQIKEAVEDLNPRIVRIRDGVIV